ncbi:MAG: single-stranded DNA-binding protein [Lachnospiraceae bacterium]|nr:single-stranded DNA-binding protein [Lachnospiraceae bacterium]
MNKVVLAGRLTRDPDIRYSQGNNSTCIARFTLAVDRRFKKQNEQSADFIGCVAFGKTGEFVEKYAKKGMKFDIAGRIQTGSYQNKDGQTVYTTDVVVEEIEFGESKAQNTAKSTEQNTEQEDQFMNVPDDDALPFN